MQASQQTHHAITTTVSHSMACCALATHKQQLRWQRTYRIPPCSTTAARKQARKPLGYCFKQYDHDGHCSRLLSLQPSVFNGPYCSSLVLH